MGLTSDTVRSPGIARAAAFVLAAQAAALLIIALLEIFRFASGDVSLPAETVIALIALTVLGALAFATFSWGTLRGISWARSGGIVFEVLAIVIAGASMTVQPVVWLYVIALAVPGIIGFLLLIASAGKEGPPQKKRR